MFLLNYKQIYSLLLVLSLKCEVIITQAMAQT